MNQVSLEPVIVRRRFFRLAKMSPADRIGIAVVSSLLAVFVVFPLASIYAYRESERAIACAASLHHLESAKEQYALDNRLKTGSSIPAGALWELGGYIKAEPECPSGGRYTLGRLGELPSCSHGGEHVFDNPFLGK